MRDVLGVRRKRAVCIVSGFFLLLCCSSAFEFWETPGVAQAALDADTWGIEEEMKEVLSLDAVGEGTEEEELPFDPFPEGFAEEAYVPDSCSLTRWNEQTKTLCFIQATEAQDAFDSMTAELVGKGWKPVGANNQMLGTFQKTAGTFRWLYVASIQSGDEATTVVRYEHET